MINCNNNIKINMGITNNENNDDVKLTYYSITKVTIKFTLDEPV